MGKFVWTLGTLLSPFKGVLIIDPDGSRKEKEDYNPPKGVVREHEGGNLLLIIITSKVSKQAF